MLQSRGESLNSSMTMSLSSSSSSSSSSEEEDNNNIVQLPRRRAWARDRAQTQYTQPTQLTQKQFRGPVPANLTRFALEKINTHSIFTSDELEDMTQYALENSKRSTLSEMDKRRRRMGWSEHDLGPEVRKLVEDNPVVITAERSEFLKMVTFKSRMRRVPPKLIHETIEGKNVEVLVIPDDDDPDTWYDKRFPPPDPEEITFSDDEEEDTLSTAEIITTPTENTYEKTTVELIYAKTPTKTDTQYDYESNVSSPEWFSCPEN